MKVCFYIGCFLFLNIPVIKIFSQQVSLLKGRWEGTLDQNKEAEKNSGYNLHYQKGAFVKGTPTHSIIIDIVNVKDKELSGTEIKRLTTDTSDFAVFSFTGTLRDGYFNYQCKEKLKEHLTLSIGYCFSNAKLKYSEDAQFEYLIGAWKGTIPWGYCADAWVFLKRKKNIKENIPHAINSNNQNYKIPNKSIIDTAERIKTVNERDSTTPVIPLPVVLMERKNELMKSLVVNSGNVKIKLYDNGEIDDDTISVYFDKKLVLSKKKLAANPLIINLKLDEENYEHELVMVAENLGRIPPNTSLMIVEAGDQRFELRITSTKQKNAVVRFKYRKP